MYEPSSIKSILITGASSGIGRALSYRYSHSVSNLTLTGRNEKELSKIVEILNTNGCNTQYITGDLTNENDIKKIVDFHLEKFETLDLAILNAGENRKVVFENLSTDDARKLFELNVFSIIKFIEILTPVMINQCGGTIAAVSSLAESRGMPGSSAYCASKAALSHFLEAARIELKNDNIRIITIKPGFVKTNMTKKNNFYMPFLMEVDTAANIIVVGIEKRKKIISFPVPMAILSHLGKIIPVNLFDLVMKYWKQPV